MFGYLIPRNYMEAMQFDSENKNGKWYDAIKLDMESMLEYKVFKRWDKAILDKHKKVMNPPKGYHRIKVHLVFAVKFDGRHKARLVADGHLTPEHIENIYSGVVSLRNLRLVIFLGKLNHLNCQAICTHDLTFIYFGVVAPGSTNDIIAITKTDNLMDEIWKLAPGRFLVGDAAYELTEHLLTPFTGSQRLDQGKDAFNFYLSQVRIRIEMAFG